MKFQIERSKLTLAINTVCRSISNRTTLPVLENIYIELGSSEIILRGNDLELGIEYRMDVVVLESSEIKGVLLNASTLSDIIGKLNSDTIEITIGSTYKCNIKSDSIDFDILGLGLDEYPQFPTVEKEIQFKIQSSVILDLIKHTIFSVSYDETKQFLNGIKIEAKDNRCDFISTDGFRLSVKYAQVETAIPSFSCIVPFKTMSELSKIISAVKTEDIHIQLSERQISFNVGRSLIVSRLINGRFPDYQQVIPKETGYEYKLSRQLLLSAAERASIIASHSNFVVKFEFLSDTLTISASNAKLGDYVEKIALSRHMGDKGMVVSFNIRLMQEALRIIDQQDVVFELNSELSPCVIKPLGDSTYTHILMPIRMSEYAKESPASVDPVAVST